ncbi:MAG TPA: MFS transporter [Rubrobacteraceae bacterium]|nr:MFS transporter [Rubrobacteraceae bacterium]
MTTGGVPPGPAVRLGLKENRRQFALLVVVNAFVGGMIGLERTVVPLVGSEEFGLVLRTAIFSFIVSFGVVKACSNLLSGSLADSIGRKKVLVAGWIVGAPVPFMIMLAPSWGWIVAANALLGVNQGLAWSMTVLMKIDLVGPRQRGLATGLNEFAGYLAVGLTALATGYLASVYGLRPEPFYLGVGYVVLGLLISVFLVRDTGEYVRLEMRSHPPEPSPLTFREVFALTSLKDRNLFSCSQAGLVNNLNDGMSWGVFPIFFSAFGLGVERIGILKAVYPAVSGILQVATGPMSDRFGRKWLIVGGMWVQAAGIFVTVIGRSFGWWLWGSVLLGLGTAMVYPTLIAAVSDNSHVSWRARSLSVYRFWRDLGYAVGALAAGIIADTLGISWAIGSVGALTFLSGGVVAVAMREKRPGRTGEKG